MDSALSFKQLMENEQRFLADDDAPKLIWGIEYFYKRPRVRSFKKKLGHLIEHKFCLVCGSENKLTVDHIVPRNLGGAVKAKENLMFLCSRCNSCKGDERPEVWIKTLFSIKKHKKNYCPKRMTLLDQAVRIAVNYHRQSMSFRIAA